VAAELARRGVFVWSGHNFALETVRRLGIDEEEGVVRIGAAHYNTIDEIDAALEALEGVLSA
ncbi:MAG: cysteine desulfurase-like protein, partial [Candidatus Eremiobacteraeota bacterium]|nr:cysteine desulfurase-like protein [Candidatus Eremiobacteraeota bacterium]